ncbi:MAG TPA: L-seryl-tRNA(Sec) selenium transferase [Dehalococcoidia bacterium]|nr:L-seryl-tRNA(Sec) selenium transferase [Dehalococcoidia bacterium]
MQFRDLPSVDRVMASDGMAALTETYPRDWVVDLVRRELDRARQQIRDGGKAPSAGDVADGVGGELRSINEVAPRQVINATGVIVHTNLGRAPLSQSAIDAMTQAARGYTDLEMDLSTGRRGSRQAHLQSLLQQVTGAEAALAVNNNASALLLGLSALSVGKEVIVSRGEAVEIGGGFRIPDVLKQSGATLVDVGTTNRTYIRDYQDAITDNTSAMLKVHSSNFRVEGFTAEVEPSELVELSKERGIPVLHDVGSGALLPTEAYGLAHEPTPQQSIAAGVGLVFFSGDKLLGGPQSGIVVGQTELVRRLERHPLARAVRIDKMSLAGLTATVLHYLKQEAEAEVPIWKMISAGEQGIKDRATRWKTQLSIPGEVISGRSAIGGGSLPGETLPTWVLALSCEGDAGSPERVMRRLREAVPPVIARIEDDRVILDPRTVTPDDEEALLTALREAFSG